MMCRISWLLAILCTFTGLKAQNDYPGIRSTLITYENTDSSQYLIRFKVVVECSAGSFYFDSLGVTSHQDTFGIPFSAFTKTGETQLYSYPGHCPDTGACRGGTGYGHKELVYEAPLDLRAYTACEFRVFYQGCCRNPGITTGQAGQDIYNYCLFYRCLFNSGPELTNPPQVLARHNSNYNYSPAAAYSAADRDSLSFQLAVPLKENGSAISYAANYNVLGPMTYFGFPNYKLNYPGGFHLDPLCGNLYFRPTQNNQVGVVVIEVREWREINGVMMVIGIIRLDFELRIISPMGLKSPEQPDLNNVFSLCEQSSFSRNIVIEDGDLGDSLTYDVLHEVAGLSWSPDSDSGNKVSFAINWTPPAQTASRLPYFVTVMAHDNQCPPGFYSRTLMLYVEDSNTAPSYLVPDSISLGFDFWIRIGGTVKGNPNIPFTWKTDGDGHLYTADETETWYRFGPNDLAERCEIHFSLGSLDAYTCFPHSLRDTLTLYRREKSISAGPDQVLRWGDTVRLNGTSDVSGSQRLIWSTTGQGVFADSLQNQTIYYPGPEDSLNCSAVLVVRSSRPNECEIRYDTVNIQFESPEPEITYQSKTMYLDTLYFGMKHFDYPVQFHSSGTGQFQQHSDTTFIYLPSVSDKILDTLWLRISISHCGTVFDSIAIRPQILLHTAAAPADELLVYPNPFCDLISVSAAAPFKEIFLTDLSGKLLYRQSYPEFRTECVVHVPDLPPSMYLLHLPDRVLKVVKGCD